MKVGENQGDCRQSFTLKNKIIENFEFPLILCLFGAKHGDSSPLRSFSKTHQPHVICQDAPAHPLWDLFGGETRQGVVVQLASFLPERRQRTFVFSRAHPGERLFLVRQEGRGHRLQRTTVRNSYLYIKLLIISVLYHHKNNCTIFFYLYELKI